MSDPAIDKYILELDRELSKEREFHHKLKLAAERKRDAWKLKELLDDTSIPPAPKEINERHIGWVLLWIGVTVAFICAFAYVWVNQ